MARTRSVASSKRTLPTSTSLLFLFVMTQKDPNHDDYCLEQYKHQFQADLLQGRVAFITGGGSGIGFRMAELLMRHGCHVAIGSRRRDKLQEVGVTTVAYMHALCSR